MIRAIAGWSRFPVGALAFCAALMLSSGWNAPVRAEDRAAPPAPALPPGHQAIPSHGGMMDPGAAAPGQMPPGHPPLGAPMPMMQRTPPIAAAPDAKGRFHTQGLIFTLPKGWTSETPSSSMRLAQVAIPGDAGPAQLVVFHFGAGQGGGAEDNLQRWIAQVQVEADGEKPKRDSFDVATPKGMAKVSTVDVSGTLQVGGMGTGPTTSQPGSRLIGAVVEAEGGPWFLKATGPKATLESQRAAFLDLLHNLSLE